MRLRDACVSGNITIAVPTLLVYKVLNVLTHVKPTRRSQSNLAQSLNKYGF